MANLPGRLPRILFYATNQLPPIDGVPTLEQIGREYDDMEFIISRRRRGMDLEDTGDVLLRYQRAVNTRWADDVGLANNVGVVNQIHQNVLEGFQNLTEHLTQQVDQLRQDLTQQVDQLRQDLTQQVDQLRQELRAGRRVDVARSYNRGICYDIQNMGVYRQLVKFTPGHPYPNPPANIFRLDAQFVSVNLENGYGIGVYPPPGLTPTNNQEMELLARLGDQQKLNVLRGIAWFYNEPELQLAADADHDAIHACMANFRTFMTSWRI